MSQLQSLRAARSLHDVAALLHFKPKGLAFILYRKPPQTKYQSFDIAKRGGGVRHINAPAPDLKLLQRRLSELLQDCVDEINRARQFQDQMAHGFKRGRSIISNATKHRKRKYVFNIDLQDFFPSINFGRVRGFFLKNTDFALEPAIATILAQIACHDNYLPQGSPCSPVVSNLIGHVLDVRLSRLAFENGCIYSRYADDITFSTSEPNFPGSIAEPDVQPHEWKVGGKLDQIVARAGFAINSQKTRMQYRTSRQDVTGLVVNSTVNIRADYRRRVRAMAHRLFMTGQFELVQTVADATGVLTPTRVPGTIAQLHGMLGHIDRVDWYNVETKAGADDRHEKGQPGLGSKENLYRRFLMFKEFYAAQAPVVICEGKTDNIYLLHAIRALASSYPNLASISSNNAIVLNVRIFKYPNTSTGRILRLGGGTGDLSKFIPQYVAELTRFKAPGKLHPVLLLVDNDDGAKPLFSIARQFTKGKFDPTKGFVHVFEQLYLVPTPIPAGGGASVIENSFGASIWNLTLGGKQFSPKSKSDPTTHFGKHILSQYVQNNAGKIDFSGFAEILRRLNAAIDDYRMSSAPTTGVAAISTQQQVAGAQT